MQTLGTALQLAGSVITFGGLLYAWHIASGRLAQWRDAVKGQLAQLRNSIASMGRGTTHQASATLTVQPEFKAEMELIRGGTMEERIKRLENESNQMMHQLRGLDFSISRGDQRR
jgi:hypothetical protein